MHPLGPEDDETQTSTLPAFLVCGVFWGLVVLYVIFL
jgi:hypothetical protein